MQPRPLFLLLLLPALAGGCGRDADLDGFSARDDCDDSDPFTYPGAPDDPGDGIDADCDGTDPAYAFVDTWTLTTLSIAYSSLELIDPGTEGGSLTIDDQMLATLSVDATLDPAVVGSAIPITLTMEGDVSPIPGPDRLTLYAEGELYSEQMHIDWDCEILDAEMFCGGELKAFDGSLSAAADFRLP